MTVIDGETYTYDCKTQEVHGPSWFRHALCTPADTQYLSLTLKLENPPEHLDYALDPTDLQVDTAIEEGDYEAMLQKDFRNLFLKAQDRCSETGACTTAYIQRPETRRATIWVQFLSPPSYRPIPPARSQPIGAPPRQRQQYWSTWGWGW